MSPPVAPVAIDPTQLAAAGTRFVRFFRELAEAFAEREDLLAQISMALVSREHVLMTGPPGTGKSQVASAVLGRILDERTGRASLYSRQFTESTVQTDLVGPIDFKTLMETGRTEHFTDEGMLGEVHAFLDEVFDGRDMLLRSALNVLQERELKQGSKTTQGRIEVALMTTNRYLAEVLDSSRDTLLAFVDRVAFVAYLPRGFGDPKNLTSVLIRQLTRPRSSPSGLEASLSVQDLDLLQAWTESVYLSEAACGALSLFLEGLEIELAQVARADPSFQPTRYLSTRTAVRAGRILRAAVVIDRLFVNPNRPMQVLPEDFRYLRFYLLLCGPSLESTEKLLARETDPRERRQLGIVRAEREAFERCLQHVVLWQPNTPRMEAALAKVETMAVEALKQQEPSRLAQLTRDLIPIVHAGGVEGDRAAALLRQAIEGMCSLAVRVGLSGISAGDAREVIALVTELSALAGQLDSAGLPTQAMARWLRGRALAHIDLAIRFDPGARADDVTLASLRGREAAALASSRIESRLVLAEQLAHLRAALMAAGAERPASSPGLAQSGSVPPDGAWASGITALEEDLAGLADVSFRGRVIEVLSANNAQPIEATLGELAGDFAALDVLGNRLASLGAGRSRLKERVVGPRLVELLGALFGRLSSAQSRGIVEHVDGLLLNLSRAGLADAVPPLQWLVWTAVSLVNAESTQRPAGGVSADGPGGHHLEGYRVLRRNERRTPITVILREVAFRALPEVDKVYSDPAKLERATASLVLELPAELKQAVAELDVLRVERSVAYLEQWWRSLALNAAVVAAEPARSHERLTVLASSGLLAVVQEEGALLRFSLEARLVGSCFPDHMPVVDSLVCRVDALHQQMRTAIGTLSASMRDEAWSAVLGFAPTLGVAR